MNRILLTLLLFFGLLSGLSGQDPPAPDTIHGIDEYTPLWESDTLVKGPDSLLQYQQAPLILGDTTVVEPDFSHSPTRALMFALVLPGLGQAYNGKYWKIPIVWLAIGGGAYAISFNTSNFRTAARDYSLDNNDINRQYLDFWRRNMELSYIAALAIYGLQALDAYVDALLFSWDVNENLSMRLAPSLQPLDVPTSYTAHSIGLTASFKLKGQWAR